MGLELVEVMFDVEKAFAIKIGDKDLFGRQPSTVGAFYDIVLRTARRDSPLSNHPQLETLVWGRIVKSVCRQSPGTLPSQIKRETRFIEDLGFG